MRLLRWKLSETRVIIREKDSSQASACGLSSFQKMQNIERRSVEVISYFRDGRLYEAESFLSVVKLDYTECPMIAGVGGGVKTYILIRLQYVFAVFVKKEFFIKTTNLK